MALSRNFKPCDSTPEIISFWPFSPRFLIALRSYLSKFLTIHSGTISFISTGTTGLCRIAFIVRVDSTPAGNFDLVYWIVSLEITWYIRWKETLNTFAISGTGSPPPYLQMISWHLSHSFFILGLYVQIAPLGEPTESINVHDPQQIPQTIHKNSAYFVLAISITVDYAFSNFGFAVEYKVVTCNACDVIPILCLLYINFTIKYN